MPFLELARHFVAVIFQLANNCTEIVVCSPYLEDLRDDNERTSETTVKCIYECNYVQQSQSERGIASCNNPSLANGQVTVFHGLWTKFGVAVDNTINQTRRRVRASEPHRLNDELRSKTAESGPELQLYGFLKESQQFAVPFDGHSLVTSPLDQILIRCVRSQLYHRSNCVLHCCRPCMYRGRDSAVLLGLIINGMTLKSTRFNYAERHHPLHTTTADTWFGVNL